MGSAAATDRLIAMSASFEVGEIALESIWEVDTAYWFDERQHPTVRDLIEHIQLIREVDLAYPIILGPDSRVMDGMHRVARPLIRRSQDHPVRAIRPHSRSRLSQLDDGDPATMARPSPRAVAGRVIQN